MLRPLFIFKVLVLSLFLNFVFILYFLLNNHHHHVFINNDNNNYEVNDYYSLHENNPISTSIKIIPMPMFISTERSRISLSNDFRIVTKQKPAKDLQLAIDRYSRYISLLIGNSTVTKQDASSVGNKLTIDCPLKISKKNKYPKLDEDESYTLNILDSGPYLYALSLTGIIRGLSTFIQLIERNASSGKAYVPFVNIIDRPRFPWRGLMLDVSRHWMPVPVIERTLNAMELCKLNVLHLHLSDDQGFRVESIQHSLLHDRKDFFTQSDIRYLVEYARQRRIRIIPEFDIPGHTTR